MNGCGIVLTKHACEIEASNVTLKLCEGHVDLLFELLFKIGAVGEYSLCDEVGLKLGKVTGKHGCECAAVGCGLGGHIYHKLLIGCKACTAAARKSALGREVGIRAYKATLEGVAADKLNKEAFTASVAAYKKAAECAAVGNRIKVVKKRIYLLLTADCDIGRTDTRYNACRKGRKKGVEYPFGDFYFSIFKSHISVSSL